MIIAGAGGHALEVIDLLSTQGYKDLTLYGEQILSDFIRQSFQTFSNLEQIPDRLRPDPRFCLGLGNPAYRQKLYRKFTSNGGVYFPLRGEGSRISSFAQMPHADVMTGCYVGSQAQIGIGSLINTGAQVHHEVQIGEFTVINPAAILLGACQIGNLCSIGANATILPGIKIGNHVTVGAGAVIIRDVPDGETVVGVPGRLVSKLSQKVGDKLDSQRI